MVHLLTTASKPEPGHSRSGHDDQISDRSGYQIATGGLFPKSCSRVLLLLGCFASFSEAHAQTTISDISKDAFLELARTTELGNALQALTIFGGTPGISSARYTSDPGPGAELKLRGIKLPPSYTFEPEAHGPRPYIEGTFGYLNALDKRAFSFLPGTVTVSDAELDTYTAIGGAGLAFDIAEGTVMRPIVLAGYSRIEDDVQLSGDFADQITAVADGVFFNVVTNSYVLGGALELTHKRKMSEDLGFMVEGRYSHFFVDVFNASDRVLETSDFFGTLTLRTELEGPTGATLFGSDLNWVLSARGVYLPGQVGDALGFSAFGEFGGGVKVAVPDLVPRLQAASLRAAGIVGGNVTGWTVGVSLHF